MMVGIGESANTVQDLLLLFARASCNAAPSESHESFIAVILISIHLCAQSEVSLKQEIVEECLVWIAP